MPFQRLTPSIKVNQPSKREVKLVQSRELSDDYTGDQTAYITKTNNGYEVETNSSDANFIDKIPDLSEEGVKLVRLAIGSLMSEGSPITPTNVEYKMYEISQI